MAGQGCGWHPGPFWREVPLVLCSWGRWLCLQGKEAGQPLHRADLDLW